MKVIYRPLVASDHTFCIHVHHISMRAYVEPLWGWDEALQDRLALEFLKHRNAIHEIAVVGETPIGYLSYQDNADSVLLNILHLHPDHHGQGHGTQIILKLIRMAHSNRKPVELSVLVTNPRARTFYERHGFIAVEGTAQKIRMRRSDAEPT
jgi:GNAT superfamily N-acetyltransferase